MKRLHFPVAALLAAAVTFSLFLLMHQLISLGGDNRAELDAIAGIHFGPVEIPDHIVAKSRKRPERPPPPDDPPPPPKMHIPRIEQQVRNMPRMELPDLDLPLTSGEGMFLGNFQQVDNTAEGDIIPVVVIRPMYPREAAFQVRKAGSRWNLPSPRRVL